MNWSIRLIALFFFSIFGVTHSLGQKLYPTDYFRSPLDIPLNLSGNFGELRTNHFHSGIDIKTNQMEGLPVYAAAEGFVSRIKVSAVGYGYALYIDHPNGYTTVYGHLKSYSAKIDAYVKEQQYKQQSFAVDLFPAPTTLPVEKGELVALSGNTGGSGGPHLHFEIRETVSEKLINPLHFGFTVKDKIPPSILGVWIIPMSDSTWVNGVRSPKTFETAATKGNVGLKTTTLPTVYGDIAFAIHTSDMYDGNANRCGIYRIELYVDGLQVYGQQMDRLDFTTNRAMNAHTIYEKFKKDRSSIHGSFRLPGNPLDIYDNLVNDGVVTFKDGKKHLIEYVVKDLMGNTSSVKFNVQALPKATAKVPPPADFIVRWDWEILNTYSDERLKIEMPPYTLYEDLNLTISESKTIASSVTPTYKIASPYEPIHSPYTLSIHAPKVPKALESKAVVVRYDPDKEKLSSEGGKMENGWITAKPSYLGYFGVAIDTIAPNITNVSFGPNMAGKGSFTIKISDYLSGIDKYIPMIDGQWALMEHDAKTNRLIYYFDPRYISKGSHTFELTVLDAVGNSKTFKGTFVY